MRATHLLLAAGLAAAAAAPAVAQDASFEAQTEVVSVEVPVNVVDRDGHPLRGLSADQFEVSDDAGVRELSGFEVIDLTTSEESRRDADSSHQVLASRSRRHFLFLFDLSFSNPTAIVRARLAAREFLLRELHPSDLAAVATFSLQRGPKLVVTFTPDRAQVARGIDTLGLRSPSDLLAERDPLQFMIAPPDVDTLGLMASQRSDGGNVAEIQADQLVNEHMRVLAHVADQTERQHAQSRITGFTSGLGDLARALDAVAGRKQVILFSEGIDSLLMLGRDPSSEEYETDTQNLLSGRIWMTDSDSRFGNTQMQNDLNRMLEEFRRADCVVHTIDIGGLRADVAGKPGATARPNGQEVLFFMANETGGELFRNANDFGEQLGRVLERSSVTYLLSFQRSDLPADGSYHKLRVRVRDLPPGARISHRAGYYAPRPFPELHPLEKNLLASDGIASGAARRDVQLDVLSAPFRANATHSYVPVVLEVQGKSLLTGHTGDDLDIEIYGYVSDSKGEMRDFFTQKVRVDLGRARRILETSGLKYYGHFDLAPGQYRVRILVRNGQTGRTGVESVSLSVPAYDAKEPFLLPPFFIAGESSWLMIRERDDEAGGATVVYPFTVNGEPYVPAAKPVLETDRRASLCLVGYNLGDGELRLEGRVVGADGSEQPAPSLALTARTNTGIAGLDKLLATFEPEGLAPGDYVLQVAVLDAAGDRREDSSVPFTVR
jgi:VWFA-related protein